MAKELYNTPNLDELENGPWPSFVTGLKRLATDEHDGANMVRDVLATLETSYVTKKDIGKAAPLVLLVTAEASFLALMN
jgi:sulfite reductase alpha subunit